MLMLVSQQAAVRLWREVVIDVVYKVDVGSIEHILLAPVAVATDIHTVTANTHIGLYGDIGFRSCKEAELESEVSLC